MARGGPSNEAVARWEGGLRTAVSVGEFRFVVDEPVSAGGGNAGPMPTDYFLGSLASCYALALVWEAGKRGLEMPADLEVTAQGRYEGPSFAELEVRVRTSLDDETLEPLMAAASRVCYVSRTVQRSAPIEVRRA